MWFPAVARVFAGRVPRTRPVRVRAKTGQEDRACTRGTTKKAMLGLMLGQQRPGADGGVPKRTARGVWVALRDGRLKA